MAGKEILISSLLEPGAMFKVSDKVKDHTLSPGSLGFISTVRGIDESYQNVAKVAAIMIRRGKSGKPRMMSVTLCTPVFYVDHESFDKLMPKDSSRKYYTHIERDLPIASTITGMPPLEFLGYAVAISRFIKAMSDKCKHRRWPESKSNPINILKRMPEYFEEDPEAHLNKFTNNEFRGSFIAESRQMISSLIRVYLQLDMIRIETEINAAEFLLFTNKGEFIPKDAEDKTNEYKFTDDIAMLKRTVGHHKKLHSNTQKLYQSKKNS